MKRLAVIAAATTLLPTPVAAETARACTGWEFQVDHQTPPDVREHRMRRLIECVFREVGIPGEVSTAYVIADRESGYAPWALNPSSGAAGLFQHLQNYWPDRAARLPRDEFPRHPDSSVFHPRANVWSAAIMVKASGWGAWSTA